MLYSILFIAVVAFTRTEQVGDVAVSCDEGAGWTFSASAAKEDGAETVTVSLSAPNECHPPKFDVDFRFSGADVHHVWSTDYSSRDMTLWPGLWPEGKSYVSQLAREAPLLAALNANDRSRLTMAASEAFNRVHYGAPWSLEKENIVDVAKGEK